jgi:twinkle protein
MVGSSLMRLVSSREGASATALPAKGEGVDRSNLLIPGECKAIPDRGLLLSTCVLYDYKVGSFKGHPAQISAYRNDQGEVVSQHLRLPTQKGLWINRQPKLQLFGSHLGSQGTLVLAEGQIDAMSVFQALEQGTSYSKETFTCCSITDGAQGGIKSIEENIGYISRFDKVIIFFDMDEPGRKASLLAAKIIGHKARVVARFPHKDANEATMADDAAAIRLAVREAQPHRPEHVLPAASLLGEILEPRERMGILFPWEGWNGTQRGSIRTWGMRPGEMWLLTGGTGLGKSAFAREIALRLALAGNKVSYIPLEQTCADTVELMLNVQLGRRVDTLNPAERSAMAEPITQGLALFQENLLLCNTFGGEELEDFVNTVRHLVLAEGSRVVFLDHFSMLADGMSLNTSQQRAIDQALKRLKTLAVELKFTLFMLCHLSRQEGKKSHEEGLKPELSHLRGSHGLAQVPDFVIALQANRQAEDPIEANTTHCWLLKNRPFGGKLGQLNTLYYDSETSRLAEVGPIPSIG